MLHLKLVWLQIYFKVLKLYIQPATTIVLFIFIQANVGTVKYFKLEYPCYILIKIRKLK